MKVKYEQHTQFPSGLFNPPVVCLHMHSFRLWSLAMAMWARAQWSSATARVCTRTNTRKRLEWTFWSGKLSKNKDFPQNNRIDRKTCVLTTLLYTAASRRIDGEDIRLMLWDTAGQEEFDAITKSYYRGAQACVLAFSSTDRMSFEAIKNWKLKVSNVEFDYCYEQECNT